MALRARTGSFRFDVDSLELKIAEMEEAKAAGSLRLDFDFEILVELGFVGSEAEECEESDSESELEGEDAW